MPWLEDLKFPRGYQMGTHKIKKGSHTITIQFHAPFKNAGLGISVLSIMIGGFWIWKKSKNL